MGFFFKVDKKRDGIHFDFYDDDDDDEDESCPSLNSNTSAYYSNIIVMMLFQNRQERTLFMVVDTNVLLSHIEYIFHLITSQFPGFQVYNYFYEYVIILRPADTCNLEV